MDASQTVSEIASAIGVRPVRCGQTRLILVDGPAGSGKTTFAAALADRLHAAVIHLDDLYEGWSLEGTLEVRVLHEVIAPLREGRDVRTRRYDWGVGRFNGWLEVAWQDVVIIEGCSAGRRSFCEFASYLVWVEAPEELRLERGLQRDGIALVGEWKAWMNAERKHFATEHTRNRADVLVDAWGRMPS